jgi:hypothetical protein
MIDDGYACTDVFDVHGFPNFPFLELCNGTHPERPSSHEWNWPMHGYCELSCWNAGFVFEGSAGCGS